MFFFLTNPYNYFDRYATVTMISFRVISLGLFSLVFGREKRTCASREFEVGPPVIIPDLGWCAARHSRKREYV